MPPAALHTLSHGGPSPSHADNTAFVGFCIQSCAGILLKLKKAKRRGKVYLFILSSFKWEAISANVS